MQKNNFIFQLIVMAKLLEQIEKVFNKFVEGLGRFFESFATSKRHFNAIKDWAKENNLRIIKIENASLSETGFSFFQTSRGYSCSKLKVYDLSTETDRGCYLLVTENFGMPSRFDVRYVNANEIRFMQPYIMTKEGEFILNNSEEFRNII